MFSCLHGNLQVYTSMITGYLYQLVVSVGRSRSNCCQVGSKCLQLLMLPLLLLLPLGVGGFNTPIALGAPMLASLGHDPLTSLLVVVVFNTLASHMGSMGMAVWFGFKILGEPMFLTANCLAVTIDPACCCHLHCRQLFALRLCRSWPCQHPPDRPEGHNHCRRNQLGRRTSSGFFPGAVAGAAAAGCLAGAAAGRLAPLRTASPPLSTLLAAATCTRQLFACACADLGPANILLIGLKSTIIVGAISLVVAPIAASFLVSWRELLRSSLFVVLSVLSAAVPTAVAAIFSAEFPVLIGECWSCKSSK